MYSTQVSAHVQAPRPSVYRALLDAASVAKWRVPVGMTSQIHEFEACEGGAFRVSLTYERADVEGKSTSHTDTYHGRFVILVEDERVVEEFEFETSNPALHGTMTMTTTLTDTEAGTHVLVLHENIPDGVPVDDNEAGTRMALTNLVRLLEGREPQ